MYLRTNDIALPYRPGMDRKSAYKSVWQRHWRGFREIYPERFAHRYGELTAEKIKAKCYSEMTLGIYEFMAGMLFYLPDKHRKAIRYYRIYAHGIKNKLKQITRKTWAKAIESFFGTNPEICTDCGAEMIRSAVFSYNADDEWRKLWKTHLLAGGYFRMKRGT